MNSIKWIDDYGLDPMQFRIYARIAINERSGLHTETSTSMGSACRMGIVDVRRALFDLHQLGLIKMSAEGDLFTCELLPQGTVHKTTEGLGGK